MWTSLALMTALSWAPAQNNQLEVKNARFTYGILGQERKDSTFLPGDMVVLAFDIEGLKTADDGSARYSMTMKLFHGNDPKPVLAKVPQAMTVVNTLGGNRLPSFALTNLFTDAEKGEYTMSIEIQDQLGKTSTKLERKFTVKPMEFGIVRIGFVYSQLNEEQAGAPPHLAPPLAVPGQNLMLNFSVVGYKVAGEKEDPNVQVTMAVQDDAGNPVLKKPFSGKATELDSDLKKLKIIPFQVPVQVNRSGKYKIVITVEDKHPGGKTVTQTLDLKAVEVN
jgi:hypothetical protein